MSYHKRLYVGLELLVSELLILHTLGLRWIQSNFEYVVAKLFYKARLKGAFLMHKITMTLNGQTITDMVADDMLLVTYLREVRGLTGTHIGCDTSQCGACVIEVDGQSVKSCTMLAVQADEAQLTTIEGLAIDGTLHPMQIAFKQAHGLQCGYCTPGMVLSAIDYVEKGGALDDDSIRGGLEGNICRCTGYHNIVKAVQTGAKMMREAK